MEPVSSSTVEAVINGLSGPAGFGIILILVLYFMWKLISQFLTAFSTHLSNIEGIFSESKDELKNMSEKVQDLTTSLDKHVAVVDTRLRGLEDRLERVEDRVHK